MSKSLKHMAYDTIEAHQETIADLRTQLAKANERVALLERVEEIFNESPELTFENVKGMFSDELNKFAIEKKVEAINEAIDYYEELKASEEPIGAGSILHVCLGRLVSQQEQLRKEQE